MNGRIILYIGDGEGKTTSAIGHAIRAMGQGKRVVIINFMKGRQDTGEFKYFKGVKNIKIHLCGAHDFLIDNKNRDEHSLRVREGIKLAEKILDNKEYDLLILDELLYAVKFGLIEKEEIISLLKKRGESDIIITGREPSKEIENMADIVTRMQNVKHHYEIDKETIIGLDY